MKVSKTEVPKNKVFKNEVFKIETLRKIESFTLKIIYIQSLQRVDLKKNPPAIFPNLRIRKEHFTFSYL